MRPGDLLGRCAKACEVVRDERVGCCSLAVGACHGSVHGGLNEGRFGKWWLQLHDGDGSDARVTAARLAGRGRLDNEAAIGVRGYLVGVLFEPQRRSTIEAYREDERVAVARPSDLALLPEHWFDSLGHGPKVTLRRRLPRGCPRERPEFGFVGSTDTTVAIVAIGTTGLTGVLAPTIAGLFGKAHQKREGRERARIAVTEDRKRILREAVERMGEWNSVLMGRVVEHADGEPRFETDADITAVMAALDTHRYIVDLWFGATSDVAKAYGRWSAAINDALEERLSQQPGRSAPISSTKQLVLSGARREFLDAARPFLDVRD